MLNCIMEALFEICIIIVAIPMYIALGAIVYIVAYWTMSMIEKKTGRKIGRQPRHRGKRSY